VKIFLIAPTLWVAFMKSKFELFVIEKVKARRQELNISQKELANLMDLSIGFVGKIESPKYPSSWNLDHINKLAIILKCSPKDFLPDSPNRE
jgi:transcriptional regulator with XRE-family HTH domain